MSWRAEQTLVRQSIYTEPEKEFLKINKKLKEVEKLEAISEKGENLNANQKAKLASKPEMVQEMMGYVRKFPMKSTLWEKHPELLDLLPPDYLRKLEAANAKKKEEDIRRDERDRRAKPSYEFQARHDRPVVNVVVGKDCLYTASKDKMVLRWVLEDRIKCITTYAGHDGAIFAVGLVQGTLVSGGSDGKLMFWNPNAKGLVENKSFISCTGIIKGIVAREESSPIFATFADKLGKAMPNITIWDFEQKKALVVIDDLPSRPMAIQWGKVGSGWKIFSVHENGSMMVWSDEGKKLRVMALHKAKVMKVKFYDGKLLTASHDHTVKITDVSVPATPVVATLTLNRPINAAVILDDAVMMAGGREPREVTTSTLLEDEFHVFVKDFDNKQVGLPGPLQGGHFGPVHELVAFKDGAISVGEDGCLKYWGQDGSILAKDTFN